VLHERAANAAARVAVYADADPSNDPPLMRRACCSPVLVLFGHGLSLDDLPFALSAMVFPVCC
jgi:hypothetical protein